MPRLSAIPGLVAAALVAASAVWWLASVALQSAGGLTDVAELSARATAALILAQWILIAVLATQIPSVILVQESPALANLLAATMPLWPLLTVLWLTSKLSAITLVGTQLGAMVLAAGMVLLARAITRNKPGDELRQLFSVASGIAIASMIWLARAPLISWVSA